jgi:DNA-binding NarL/FixJ family response regulator
LLRPATSLVIVADSSLTVEAIALGFRRSAQFRVIGRADANRTPARTILSCSPDLVLLDIDQSESAIGLIRELRAEDRPPAVIVLTALSDLGRIESALDAGATGVISKATEPGALVTLVRETLCGHIFLRRPTQEPTAGGKQQPLGPTGSPLTAREVEILELVAAGSTNGEVARVLWVTEQTVKFHLRNLYRKLGVTNRTQASQFAYANGLGRSRPPCGDGGATELVAS